MAETINHRARLISENDGGTTIIKYDIAGNPGNGVQDLLGFLRIALSLDALHDFHPQGGRSFILPSNFIFKKAKKVAKALLTSWRKGVDAAEVQQIKDDEHYVNGIIFPPSGLAVTDAVSRTGATYSIGDLTQGPNTLKSYFDFTEEDSGQHVTVRVGIDPAPARSSPRPRDRVISDIKIEYSFDEPRVQDINIERNPIPFVSGIYDLNRNNGKIEKVRGRGSLKKTYDDVLEVISDATGRGGGDFFKGANFIVDSTNYDKDDFLAPLFDSESLTILSDAIDPASVKGVSFRDRVTVPLVYRIPYAFFGPVGGEVPYFADFSFAPGTSEYSFTLKFIATVSPDGRTVPARNFLADSGSESLPYSINFSDTISANFDINYETNKIISNAVRQRERIYTILLHCYSSDTGTGTQWGADGAASVVIPINLTEVVKKPASLLNTLLKKFRDGLRIEAHDQTAVSFLFFPDNNPIDVALGPVKGMGGRKWNIQKQTLTSIEAVVEHISAEVGDGNSTEFNVVVANTTKPPSVIKTKPSPVKPSVKDISTYICGYIVNTPTSTGANLMGKLKSVFSGGGQKLTSMLFFFDMLTFNAFSMFRVWAWAEGLGFSGAHDIDGMRVILMGDHWNNINVRVDHVTDNSPELMKMQVSRFLMSFKTIGDQSRLFDTFAIQGLTRETTFLVTGDMFLNVIACNINSINSFTTTPAKKIKLFIPTGVKAPGQGGGGGGFNFGQRSVDGGVIVGRPKRESGKQRIRKVAPSASSNRQVEAATAERRRRQRQMRGFSTPQAGVARGTIPVVHLDINPDTVVSLLFDEIFLQISDFVLFIPEVPVDPNAPFDMFSQTSSDTQIETATNYNKYFHNRLAAVDRQTSRFGDQNATAHGDYISSIIWPFNTGSVTEQTFATQSTTATIYNNIETSEGIMNTDYYTSSWSQLPEGSIDGTAVYQFIDNNFASEVTALADTISRDHIAPYIFHILYQRFENLVASGGIKDDAFMLLAVLYFLFIFDYQGDGGFGLNDIQLTQHTYVLDLFSSYLKTGVYVNIESRTDDDDEEIVSREGGKKLKLTKKKSKKKNKKTTKKDKKKISKTRRQKYKRKKTIKRKK